MLKNRTNIGRKGNLSFYRDRDGFEVDTIADWKHTFAVEIKSSSDPDAKASRNIKKYLEMRGNPTTRGAVFYLGDVTLTINGIDYVSWRDWSSYLGQMR